MKAGERYRPFGPLVNLTGLAKGFRKFFNYYLFHIGGFPKPIDDVTKQGLREIGWQKVQKRVKPRTYIYMYIYVSGETADFMVKLIRNP